MLENQFAYDRSKSLDIREVVTRSEAGIQVRDFTYASPYDRRRAAYLVGPEAPVQEPLAAILYVHWYEPDSPDSNRTQFLEEAKHLAGKGVVSLLIETMWSDRDWFIKRTQAEDHQNTIEQVVELRQAMDILLDDPAVDPDRLAFVGHDFGAMYGVLMGAVDPRPKAYVLMAGTPRFPDWYLYYPRLEGDDRQLFIDSFKPFDPISQVAKLAPAPVLFQFGDDDFHVPVDRGQEFYHAAGEPKGVHWYNAGHGLNQQASIDRAAWLSRQLNLSTQQKM
jgi:dienelactone hydrolase